MALLVSLSVALPLRALSALLTSLFAPAIFADPDTAQFSVADLTTNLPSLGQIVIGLLLPLFVAWVTHQAVLGRKVGMAQTWRGTKDRVLPGLGALVLTTLIL